MLKKVFSILAAACVVLSGCVDESRSPVITQDNLLFGAFPFLQELKAGEFDLANLSGSAYEMDVYFVDNAQGQDVAQYNVYVAFDDNNPGNGDLSTERALFKSFGPSDFSVIGDKGNLGLSLRIPFTEVANFVGAGGDGDVVSGDRFQFTTEVVKEDGRVFSSANSTPAVTNAFGGIFDFNVNATCPLDDDFFTGTYALSYGEVYDEFDLFGGGTFVQAIGDLSDFTVELSTVAGSTTRRSFALGDRLWLPTYGFGLGSPTLEFACDVVTSSNLTNSASCGAGPIGAIQTGTASFDLTDDSTITIGYNDFATGGCFGETKFFSLVFTKM